MSVLGKFINDPNTKEEKIGRPLVRSLVLGGAVAALLISASNEATTEVAPDAFTFNAPSSISERVKASEVPVSDAEMMERYASLADIQDAMAAYSPNDHDFYHGESELRQRVHEGESTITMQTAHFISNVTSQLVGTEQLNPAQFDALSTYFQARVNSPEVKMCIQEMGPRAGISPEAHNCLMDSSEIKTSPNTGPKSEFYKNLRAKLDNNGLTLG